MNQENQNQILAAEMTREQEFQHLKMRILQEELFCSKNWLVIFHNSRLETTIDFCFFPVFIWLMFATGINRMKYSTHVLKSGQGQDRELETAPFTSTATGFNEE